MPGLESIVPEENRLNTLVHDYRSLLFEYVDDAADAGRDIVDIDYEQRFTTESWDAFFTTLTHYMARSGDSLEDAAISTRRGFIFGLQTAETIGDGAPMSASHQSLSGLLYMTSGEDSDGTINPIKATQEYLGRNPELDAYIGYCMPYLDITGRTPHIVENSAGLALLISEDTVGADLFQAEIDKLL